MKYFRSIFSYLKGYIKNKVEKIYTLLEKMKLNEFVKENRKRLKLNQAELALKCNVGLRFMRELEQGKKSLRIDKVNQVLNFFGYEVGPVKILKGFAFDHQFDDDIIAL